MSTEKLLLPFLVALRFLTIIPISWKSDRDGDFFRSAIFFFPIIGLLIGIASSAILYYILPQVPVGLRSVLLVLILAVFSGFLHLDGLADCADGFLSSRPKEKILEIMRDSRIGAMGVLAIIFILSLKITSLSVLTFDEQLIAVVFMPVAGRCAIVFSMAILPYARKEGGLGELFYSKSVWIAAVIILIVVGLVSFYFASNMCIPIKQFGIVIFSVLFVVFLFSLWCKRIIGGATGDTLGAICEISETTIVMALSIISSMNG